ncbi:hypothetical protein L6164_023702 [Bauhinia variegata]|uniref:Uncharacterized protein n=1 Tax=Bauhinia variegata TaxID=167791 RepID=A0ACB9MP62_BAUVA|nr:hypothetical protein L6164_023702 [Bauhinia variegata]
MEIVSMVLVGKVNKTLVSLINKAGATAVGLSSMDGRLLTARPSPKAADLGFVGEVAWVDPTILWPLIDNNHIPVVTFVAADEFGQPYNNNADTVAGELAAALGKVGGGMIPKVNCCVRSLAQGVTTASIIDGRVPHSLLLEIMTDEGAGTMISG